MKNLIIHPDDITIAFLNNIYNDLPDKTVEKRNYYRKSLMMLIQDHDQIFMPGHGVG